MDNQKSYYAIIPANVRYDKDLTANAKLLYGEITALCNEKGYCWATNDYFSELYKVSKKSISTWINQLKVKNYIDVSIEHEKGDIKSTKRYISIGCGRKLRDPMEENYATPMEENFQQNNTSINNTINNIYSDFEKIIIKKYPGKKVKSVRDKKVPKLLKQYSKEQLEKAIDNYRNECKDKDKQYILNESTFWNGRYLDYLESETKDNSNTLPSNDNKENNYDFLSI